MSPSEVVAMIGAIATLIAAAGLATSRVLRARPQAPKETPTRDGASLTAPPSHSHASRNDLEVLARRVTELAKEVRHVRDRLAASEAHHERAREDLAGVREEVDELSRELLLAQIELNKTLAAFMAGQPPPAPRSRKR